MLNIAFAKKEYLSIISELESSYFGGEAYSYETLSEILKDNYILKNNTNIITINNDNELIGYIIFSILDDFTDIYKIFIRENDRYNGYATMLLDKVYSLAKKLNSKRIMIEVRSNNNVAINFYKRNEFSQISIRKNYYNNPTDDALIFERTVI